MAAVNDLVLVEMNREPAFFARINDVTPDVKRGWYQVELLVLTLPPQTVVWTLEEAHLKGQEFTMGGRPVKLVPVPPKTKPAPAPEGPAKGKIIPLVRK